MSVTTKANRVRVDGKFFRLGDEKFYVKGVTYGPFAPNAAGEYYPSPDQARKDLALVRELAANVLRVYHVPPRWFLDLAHENGLKVFVDIPWNKHLCVLDSEETRVEARATVRQAAEACAAHPAVFALSVVNEIAPDIVRWSGARQIADFIDELIQIVKEADPACLCTFGNFPPTEYLRPQNPDFICFNVYLHHSKPFENYLARLQMIADSKPLVLGEFGIDSIREGEERKAHTLSWQLEIAYRSGQAGAIVFSFTDDWYKDERHVLDWAFGLTDSSRHLKRSFHAVRASFAAAPYYPLARYPKVSVVVASYNAAGTLRACLESLRRLNYPDYEVILVDDGSSDETPEIAKDFPFVRHIRHPKNEGLSVARNTGIEAGEGEIIAFTDADCRADPDWLYYIVSDLLNSRFAGIGGHNLLPPEDSWVAAAVMVSPGGPAHVMLTDRLAEHIPGCNMAFYKWALLEIGGFDPLFRKAGDDVDVCWRLQQRGYKIGFSPAGFVWHYRRSTVRAYLKQQRGYGEAEALLVHRHPEYFNWFGGSQWQGRIYSPAKFGVVARKPMIYHGTFGSGFFQTLYTAPPALTLMLVTSLEYYALFALPLLIVGVVFPAVLPAAFGSIALSLAICGAAAAQADIPRGKKRFWSRPLVAMLFFLQPIVRGWARYQGRLSVARKPLAQHETLETLSRQNASRLPQCLEFWSERGVNRVEFLSSVMEMLDARGWPNKADAGWNNFDIEIYGSRWCNLQLITAEEALPDRRVLIRCRIGTTWTLFSKAALCALLAGELIAIGFIGSWILKALILFLTLTPFIWFLKTEQNNLRRIVTVFLEEVGQSVGLFKYVRSRRDGPPPTDRTEKICQEAQALPVPALKEPARALSKRAS